MSKKRCISRFRQYSQNVGLMIAALVVALVASETILRLVYGDKFGRRPTFSIPDDKLGWKTSPNLHHTFYGPDFRMDIRTDIDGYRLGVIGEVDYSKKIVVVLGDSNAFGWGVSTASTFPSHLDEQLYEKSGGSLRVVNLGVPGYGTFQSVLRFKYFLEKHPEARVAAVVFIHSQNDPADNLNALGYQLGIWRVKNSQTKERSRYHIVNFIAYAHRILRRNQLPESRAPDDIDTIDPFSEDMFFTHQIDSPKAVPSKISFGGTIVNLEGLTREDSFAETLLERKYLTAPQRDIFRAAIQSLYAISETRVEQLFHIISPHSPAWIENEFLQVLGTTPADAGIHVHVLGRYPPIQGFDKEILNRHSGRHFTPDFNEFWADAVTDVLVRQHITTRARESQ